MSEKQKRRQNNGQEHLTITVKKKHDQLLKSRFPHQSHPIRNGSKNTTESLRCSAGRQTLKIPIWRGAIASVGSKLNPPRPPQPTGPKGSIANVPLPYTGMYSRCCFYRVSTAESAHKFSFNELLSLITFSFLLKNILTIKFSVTICE